MAKKRTALASRAWHLLRLALIWVRKGGLLKQGFMVNLRIRLLPDHVRSLCSSSSNPYGEYEFSCDETPIFNFKLQKSAKQYPRYLPRIPCINPPIDFEEEDDEHYDFQNDDCYEDHDDDDDGKGYRDEISNEEEEIDSKAEEFIARFYEGMRLQRQVSYLQYNEMIHRGVS